jgi:hypothetical protein
MSRARSAAALAPYEGLVRIAELELELAGEGRYDELAQLGRQRDEIMGSLPRPAPPGAREPLERALAIERRVGIELRRRREQVLLSLRRVEVSKRTASGYARAMPGKRRRVRVFEQA